jgi:hypothetical protein
MRLLRVPALVFCLSVGLLAQSSGTSSDAGALFKDVLRLHAGPSQTVMALWLPFEIMAAGVKLQTPSVTDEMLEACLQ